MMDSTYSFAARWVCSRAVVIKIWVLVLCCICYNIKAQQPTAAPTDVVTPLIEWTFDDTSANIDTSKLSSTYSNYFNITIFKDNVAKTDAYDSSDGGAYLDGFGHLICISGSNDVSYALSDRLIPFATTAPKSYEVWVYNTNLSDTAGGVMSIDKRYSGEYDDVSYNHSGFDAIVWSEYYARQWNIGSEYGNRVGDFGGFEETNDESYIHLVMTYDALGNITLYHNGSVYGTPYSAGSVLTVAANVARFIFCQRHKVTSSNPFNITYAAFYDSTLTHEQVTALYCNKFIPSGESAQGFDDSGICGQYTNEPSSMPSNDPTDRPSDIPSSDPSNLPTMTPSEPSMIPSMTPSMPSMMPSMNPSKTPTMAPSDGDNGSKISMTYYSSLLLLLLLFWLH